MVKPYNPFWIFGCVFFVVAMPVYAVLLESLPTNVAERISAMQANWPSWSLYWRCEFFVFASLLIGAVHFAIRSRKIEWSVVSVGALIWVLNRPLMLGGYESASHDVFMLIRRVSVQIYLFGSVVFWGGMTLVYKGDTLLLSWQRRTAASFAAVIHLAYLAAFFGVITWQKTLLVGPLMVIALLFGAYYGVRLGKALEEDEAERANAFETTVS